MSDTLKITSRIAKNYFSIATLTLLIAVVAILSFCSKNKTQPPVIRLDETLRFVFMADSRGDSLNIPVRTPVMRAIINQIATLSPKPAFVFFGGDMSYRGNIDNNFTFQAWKNQFAKLDSMGIKLYTAIGNHELYKQHASDGFKIANQQAFQTAFPESPSNGPTGYEHLVYSFTSDGGNSFFAVLDPYYITGDIVPSDLGGNIDNTQMTWLRAQVAQSNATHKFLLIHTPYYYVSDDVEEVSTVNTSYSTLWSFLDSNNFDIYACGHSHLFSRKTIDSTVHPFPQTTPPIPNWKSNVVQLLNGTSGAGPSTGDIDSTLKRVWNVHNDAKTYYFSVVDISGSNVTVNSYKGYLGAYTVFDTFSISK